jgi:hypothetical protein
VFVDYFVREPLEVLSALVSRFNDRTGVIVEVTADYSMKKTERGVAVDATLGPVTVTLPAGTECRPWIQKVDSTGNAVTVAVPADYTLEGVYSLSGQYDVACFDLDESESTYYRYAGAT